jgi:GTP-binding protein
LKIEASLVTSAARAEDFPRDGRPEVALVGRSNVGKSTLVNALIGRRMARTSAAPGKTRLANIYRIARGAGAPWYLIDLPGFGFARGDTTGFDEVTALAFDRAPAALLLVDARHPGLDNDRAAWRWLRNTAPAAAVVATKIDKLARGERIRALRELESVLEYPALPVSAATGEGLDELWKLIDRLANSSNPNPPPRRPPRAPTPTAETAPPAPRRRRSSASTSRR